MYESEGGYWVPADDEMIVLEEFPHFVKYWTMPDKDGKRARGIKVPHPRMDGFEVGKAYKVLGVLMAQDVHYEYVYVEAPPGSDVAKYEVPLRYFKKHPTIEYPNTYKKKETT